MGMELREGTQRSAEATLDRVLPSTALRLTQQSILMRMHAGFHSKTIAATLVRHRETHQAQGKGLAFFIKGYRHA